MGAEYQELAVAWKLSKIDEVPFGVLGVIVVDLVAKLLLGRGPPLHVEL
jgi:hypothetical protein